VVYIHNGVEYYLAIKNNQILSFVGKSVELKIIILSEVRQDQKDQGHFFHLWKKDPKVKHIHKNRYHIYIYTEHVSNSGIV
jgi:hypothetical protein